MGRLYDFYTSFIGNFIAGGNLISTKNLSSLGIKPMFDRIVTKNWVKKVICITQFPLNYDYPLSVILNAEVKKASPSCKVFTNTYAIPSNADFGSQNFKRQMADAEAILERYKATRAGLSETDKRLGKKVFTGGGFSFTINKKREQELQDDYDSYEYIMDVIENQGTFSDCFFFVEIVAPNNKAMKSAFKAATDYLYIQDFKFKQLSANSSYYMSTYAPAAYIREFSTKEFMPMTMSDENLTFTDPYNTHGFIGTGKGTILGFDVQSNTPFIPDFTGSGKGQVCLFLADTGYGKTLLAMFTILSLLASDIHVTVVDIKGDEYTLLSKFLDSSSYVVVDISEDSPTYINTMRLDDLDLEDSDVEGAKVFYNLAINSTIQLCSLICNPADAHEESDCNRLLRTAVTKVFDSHGVNSEVSRTFSNTADMSYEEIIPALETLKYVTAFAQYRDLLDRMIIALNDKFRLSNIFKGQELSVQFIMETPLVIYSLNKNLDTTQTLNDSIMTFATSFLTTKKMALRKSKKLFTAAFYEEMQRKEEFKHLVSFISSTVTGARSSNAIVFLLGNSLASFDSPEMRAITSNISTWILGPLSNKQDRDLLVDFGCPEAIPRMKQFLEMPEKFQHQFICKYNTGVDAGITNIKVVAPPEMIKSFGTRTILT